MIADVLDISTDDITPNKSVCHAECCQKATDFDRLMKSVKEKISISHRSSQAIKKSSSSFGVPDSMIKNAR